METRIETRLHEIYYGIIAYGRTTYQWFGIVDFAGLAASAINYLILYGDIMVSDKRKCSKKMVEYFNRDIGSTMTQWVIDSIVDYMMNLTAIDSRIGGILAAVDMAR